MSEPPSPARYQPTADYARLVGPDKSAGEGKGTGQGGEFPHPLDGGEKALGSKFYSALANSPFGNELLLEFAKVAIEAENLGSDEVPDLLMISISGTDYSGHVFGPDSWEYADHLRRADRALLRLFERLAERSRIAVLITSDHGVAPLPERLGAAI